MKTTVQILKHTARAPALPPRRRETKAVQQKSKTSSWYSGFCCDFFVIRKRYTTKLETAFLRLWNEVIKQVLNGRKCVARCAPTPTLIVASRARTSSSSTYVPRPLRLMRSRRLHFQVSGKQDLMEILANAPVRIRHKKGPNMSA